MFSELQTFHQAHQDKIQTPHSTSLTHPAESSQQNRGPLHKRDGIESAASLSSAVRTANFHVVRNWAIDICLVCREKEVALIALGKLDFERL